MPHWLSITRNLGVKEVGRVAVVILRIYCKLDYVGY